MLQSCRDNFHVQFPSFMAMMDFHSEQAKNSTWERKKVTQLQVAPLDKESSLYSNLSLFASGVSAEAVQDTQH